MRVRGKHRGRNAGVIVQYAKTEFEFLLLTAFL